MSSSPGNGSPFTKHQRSERIYARPRCTGSRKCISSALLDELAAFPRDDEWSGRGLSLLSWGKPEEENIDIWGYSLGLALRSSNVQSQPSLNNRGDPNVPKSWVLWDNSTNYVVHFINPACIQSFCYFPKGKTILQWNIPGRGETLISGSSLENMIYCDS